MRFLFVLICLLIVYGSLFPFEFDGTAFTTVTLKALLDTWDAPTSRGDLLGNIVLFVPFGFVGTLVFARYRAPLPALALLTTLGAVVAVGSQIAQIAVPARTASLVDVVWNGIGFVVGVLAASSRRLREFVEWQDTGLLRSVPFLLVGLWISSRLIPFVPTIDWQAYKDALKPLLQTPEIALSDIWLMSGAWLACAHLGARLLGRRWRDAYLPTVIVSVLALQIIVVTRSVSASDVVAALVAMVLWSAVIRKAERRALAVGGLLLSGIIVDGLAPFAFDRPSGQFIWIPFAGYLTGSMIVNAIALCEKLFLFGAVLWLFREVRWRAVPTTLVVAMAIAFVEVAQIWLVGRTPGITDVLMVLALGAAWLRLGPEQPEAGFGHYREPDAMNFGGNVLDPGQSFGDKDSRETLFQPAAEPRQTVILFASGLAAIMAGAYMVLRLPGVPYNVRELFINDGSLFDLLFFSLAVIGFGAGAAWVGRVVMQSARPYVAAPLASVAVAVGTYLFLWLSVTRESISDIAGSSVVVQRVAERAVLGQPGVDFVAFVGAANLKMVTDIFEPVVRFGALVGPLIFVLAGILAVLLGRGATASRVLPGRVGRSALAALYFLPWFFVCKVIAFDWSSTDNLNELIARDGEYGLGGGGYLYGLVFLIAASSVALAWTVAFRDAKHITVALISGVVAIPVGWLLFNAGLIDDFTKYDTTYSGVDFFLGPDRGTHLSETVLFARWSVVQSSAVLVLAFGALIQLRRGAAAGAGLTKKWSLPPAHATYTVQPETEAESEAAHGKAFVVRFDLEQFEFIHQLAGAVNASIDAVVGSIIGKLRTQFGRDGGLRYALRERLSGAPSPARVGKPMTSHELRLLAEYNDFVVAVSNETGASQSRVVRLLVDMFIEDCRDDDAEAPA